MLSRSKLAGAAVAALIGFLVTASLLARPSSPGARLPQTSRLADLIVREQATSSQLQRQADQLRHQVDALRGRATPASVSDQLAAAGQQAGLGELRGPGLRVTLNDSTLTATGNLNDLVIHSQDIQAVVNALWRSGAEAVAVNGQRLVTTSAVLCVGNTLLLDGTVHSPPYLVEGIAADRAVFDDDTLVRRLRHDAGVVHLGFAVEHVSDLDIPGFPGPLAVKFAAPSPPPVS
jgi:uncharacterized protein YlxW (UPF0749 family)